MPQLDLAGALQGVRIGYVVVMKVAILLAWVLLATPVPAGDAPLDPKLTSLKFTGHAFLHDFHGEAKEFRGTAQVDGASPQLVQGAAIDITAAKMTTFVDARDHNMYTWLHTGDNPDIRFALKQVKALNGDLADATKEHPARFAVSGVFTLNKVDKPLKTLARAWCEGKHLIVEGAATVDTVDHGLPVVRQLFLTVDEKVDVAFHLVFDLP